MKKEHAELTDDNLEYEERKDDEFFDRLQQKLGKNKQQIVKCIR